MNHIDKEIIGKNFNKCFICGEKVLEDGVEVKKYILYSGYVKICYNCLNTPIKC